MDGNVEVKNDLAATVLNENCFIFETKTAIDKLDPLTFVTAETKQNEVEEL